jgi:hypothetical protein
MNNLLQAIMTKCSGSALSAGVGGRIFLDVAPDGTELPYVVLEIAGSAPQDTFTDAIEGVLIRFSLFSASPGATEITGIYANMKALFDYCTMTITGSTHIEMVRQSLTTMVDDITTPAGTVGLKHWAVDYSIMFQTP